MLIALCSVKGSPGVTTLATAVAARWPQPVRCVLVECDPAGGDLATRFSLASSPGLVSLVAGARRSSDPALLWQHTQFLPAGVSAVVAPPGADQAGRAMEALVPGRYPDCGILREAANVPGVVVIADCGRIGPLSAALPVVQSADATVVVSRAYADALAHLATRLITIGRWSRRPALVLTGPGYGAQAVEHELGVPVMACIPEDRRGAAGLSGRPAGRGPSRSPLGHAAARIAATLAAEQQARRISVPDGPAGAVMRPVLGSSGPVDHASRNGSSS